MRKPRAFKESGFYTPRAYVTTISIHDQLNKLGYYNAIGFSDNIGWLGVVDAKRLNLWLKKAIKYVEWKNKQ